MLNLSLRAVLRKESWMFCAGLLFSIADLLDSFELRPIQLAASAFASGPAFPRGFSRKEYGGTNLPSCRLDPSRRRRRAGNSEYATASTIRRPFEHFNIELTEVPFSARYRNVGARGAHS